MSDYGRIGDGFASLFNTMFVLLVIFIPLGLWKAVEVILYIFRQIHVSWGG